MTLLDRPVSENPTTRSLTKATALTATTRRTLKDEGLLRSYSRDPQATIRVLAERHQAEPREAHRQALAEMSSDTGDRLAERQPEAAIGYYLETARLTNGQAHASPGPDGYSKDRVLHDYSTARVAQMLHAHPELKGRTLMLSGITDRYELRVATGREFVSPWQFDLLVPASWLKFKGMDFEPVVQEGIGEAMVGHLRSTTQAHAADPLMPTFGHSLPLNAALQFSGPTVTLSLQNLMTKGQTDRNGTAVPLKGDFTAALAFLYNDRRAQGYKIRAALQPFKYRNATGLYSLEPFDGNKIPLVIVHGLLSSGGSFFNLANYLRADPVMRERYQLMLFTYPTGMPVGVTATELRGALAAHHEFYDPKDRYPALGKTVLIGHSMGGILSNLQIRSSGDRVEKLLLKKRLKDINADEASKQRLEKLIRFEANPRIERAVFIAVPHRGSMMATTTFGQFASRLIRLPFDLVGEIFEAVVQPGDLTRKGQMLSGKPRNSVSSLSPENPALPVILELPVRKGVVMHSIIAQKDPDQALTDSSDGVVPYSSSHLEAVATEKIVPDADHQNVVEDPRCVQEILRILHEHAGL